MVNLLLKNLDKTTVMNLFGKARTVVNYSKISDYPYFKISDGSVKPGVHEYDRTESLPTTLSVV